MKSLNVPKNMSSSCPLVVSLSLPLSVSHAGNSAKLLGAPPSTSVCGTDGYEGCVLGYVLSFPENSEKGDRQGSGGRGWEKRKQHSQRLLRENHPWVLGGKREADFYFGFFFFCPQIIADTNNVPPAPWKAFPNLPDLTEGPVVWSQPPVRQPSPPLLRRKGLCEHL